MKYRTLGKTGLEVSELGMGGLFVSSFGAAREEGVRAVRRALELGVNYVDTAPGYRDSEEVLGEALEGASVETSLRLLKRDQVDILMIHEPDRPGQYNWYPDWERFHGPVCELLDELKGEGIIRFTGLGGTTAYTLPHIIATGAYDVMLTAFNYSLLWQEATIAVLPEAMRQRMGIIIGSPLQQGALARPYTEQVERGARWLSPPRRAQFVRLYALVRDLDMSLPELALRFVISNPDISTVLMGARSVEEVEQNVHSVGKGPLPDDVLAEITAIAAMVPFRPFEEPFSLPFNRPYKGPGHA